MASNFLASKEWLEIVKPIVDSMLRGLTDARTIDVSSDKKAAIEVKSRTIAAEYLEKIELLIQAYITDADVSKKLIEKQNKANSDKLYRIE
jgi:hypothetical protein